MSFADHEIIHIYDFATERHIHTDGGCTYLLSLPTGEEGTVVCCSCFVFCRSVPIISCFRPHRLWFSSTISIHLNFRAFCPSCPQFLTDSFTGTQPGTHRIASTSTGLTLVGYLLALHFSRKCSHTLHSRRYLAEYGVYH